MNIVDFANQVLDMQEEINQLRGRNAFLEKQNWDYQEHLQNSNQGYEKLWGSFLTTALDPVKSERLNSFYNKGE